jgi:hypothetical protein
MSEPERGTEVPASETLSRAITSRDWWVAAENRVSSAAFTFPVAGGRRSRKAASFDSPGG